MEPRLFILLVVSLLAVAAFFTVREEWGKACGFYALFIPLFHIAGV